MFPSRWQGSIDRGVEVACVQREATLESPLRDKFAWWLVTQGAGHTLQVLRHNGYVSIFNSRAPHCKTEWMYGVHSMEQRRQLELVEGLG